MTMPKFDPACYWIKDAEQFHIGLKPFALAWKPLYTLDQLTEAYEAGKREQADELEAARAEIERKMSAADFILKERDALQADRDEWKARAEFSYRQRDELNRLCEFNEKTMSALQADNVRLRKVMQIFADLYFKEAINALATTHEQSLARIRNQVREECALEADRQSDDEPYGHAKFRCANIALELRAMKEPE